MDSWNRLSTLLLETNHIQIPIEKRFFLSLLDDDTDDVSVSKILDKIERMGFLEDDPRLTNVRGKLKTFKTMKYEEFKYCIENDLCILHKIFKHELIIPNFKSFTDKIETIYELTKDENHGREEIG